MKTLRIALVALVAMALLLAGVPPASAQPTVIATIPVGGSPHGVGVNPDTNRIYVANYGSDNVSVIDGATNSVIATVAVGGGPAGMTVNPNTGQVYVANYGDDTVSVLPDGLTIPVGDSPFGIGVNPNTGRVYVANEASADVSVIDGGEVTTVEVGYKPRGVGVNPTTNLIYIGDYNNAVWVIEGDTNTVIDTLSDSWPWSFYSAWDVEVNPVTNRIYVASCSGGWGMWVKVIDGDTNTIVDRVQVGSCPWQLAVNPSTSRVYVSNLDSDNVSIIDGATNDVVDTVPVGDRPAGVGVNPNSGRVYVANYHDDTVSVIEDIVGPTPEEQLAAKYAPILYLAEQDATCDDSTDTDPYDPVAVEIMLGREEVRLMENAWPEPDTEVTTSPTATDLYDHAQNHYLDVLKDSHPRNRGDRCDYETTYEQALAEGVPRAVYAWVAELDTNDDDATDHIALQYWFFYYFNDWDNRHEGDWELIQLLFPAASVEDVIDATPIDPSSVGYSQHIRGHRLTWDGVQKEPEGSDHPVVYVGAGSHANYFAPGHWRAVETWVDYGCDYAPEQANARRLDDGTYQLRLLPSVWTRNDPYAWLEFRGEWGELSTWFFSGPKSPLDQPWGEDPWNWNENLTEGANSPCVARQQEQSTDSGSSLLETGQSFMQQVVVTIGDIVVFFITWGNSEASLTLETPSGTTIDSSTVDPNVYHEKGTDYEVYRISNAELESWTMNVEALDFPDGPEVVTWEAFGVPPACDEAATSDPSADPDLDSVVNSDEGLLGTDLCHWDSDRDTFADGDDNCPTVYNPGQEDGDGDGVGDACDDCPDVPGPAENNGCPFVLCGDVDCDDDVDAVDALFILQYVVGLRLPSDQCPPPEGHLYLSAGDVDCDDDVDAVDALFVLQHVVNLRPELCECPTP